MYPTASFNEEEVLGRLWMCLSQMKICSTHWGNSEMVRVEYNRQEILEK